MGAPIVLPDTSGLAEGILGASSVLSQALAQKGMQKKQEAQQKQYGNILANTISKLDQDPSPINVTRSLLEAVQQGLPMEMAQQYGSLYSTLNKAQQQMIGPEQVDEMSTLFEKFGMDKDTARRNAELWGKLTTGGQTEMAKLLVDQISRQQFQPQAQLGAQQPEVVGEVEETIEWPKVDVFQDRTPKERAALKTELLKMNNAAYKENMKSLEDSERLTRSYQQLKRLNESGKLPSGVQNWNVNWTTGDLRIPWAANAETQQYVKTINDFTVQAKNTFGARVTNFELASFMKRLPTLANNEAGRRVILEQMESIEQLNTLYAKTLKETYDRYGIQNIDSATAEKIAYERAKELGAPIIKKYEDSIYAQEVYEARAKAPEGHLPVKKPDGSKGYLPMDKIEAAKKKGWEVL